MEKIDIVKKKSAFKDSVYIQKVKILAVKYFTFIPLIFFIALLGIGYYFLLAPKYGKVKNEIENFVNKREQERDKYEEYFNRFSKIKQSFSKVAASDIDKLNRLLPGEPETEKLMVELESIISGKGVYLSSIKASQEAAKTAADGKAKTVSINFDISLAGINYRTLKLLLTDLENNLRLLDVKKVDFSPSNSTANLSIAAYYMPVE